MRKPRIAVLGATGVVGREILKITEELGIDFESIRFLSSAKSAGSKLAFKGQEYTVEEAVPEIFNDVDIVMASQEVILGSNGQTLRIRHDSTDRECYMPGVLLAIRYVSEHKSFVYGLDNIL